MSSPRIAFIGAGKMATALAKGLVGGAVAAAESITASDPSPAALDAFAAALPGCQTAQDNTAAVASASIVILAIKPQCLPDVLKEIRSAIDGDMLVISIAAGFPLRRLAEGLPGGTRIVRVMPNTPALVGRGASAFSRGEHASTEDGQTTARLLAAVGIAHEVPEPLLDAVTGLSGSGPAFVYTVIEAMIDAGVRAGVPRAIAADLAIQTVAGAAQMVIETGDHPAALRNAVTSPGGTTAAGLAELERLGLRAALDAAIAAATEKSKELGGGS